jgi:uncharacterized protein (UPF0276 family)
MLIGRQLLLVRRKLLQFLRLQFRLRRRRGMRRWRLRRILNYMDGAAKKQIKSAGVGIGYREPFRSDLFLHRGQVDFLEITSDHYLDANPRKIEELKLLMDHFPLIPHSLDLSLGSAEGVDREYLEKLAALADMVQPDWFSDHICFTRSGGAKIGHLAPVPYTREALKVFARNIRVDKDRIKTPLILENITYMMRFPSSEMTEAEFIGRLLDETGCGLLLDVTNLYINSRNFGFDWRAVLDALPMERVVQLHFVGSHAHSGGLIDAHADATQDEIWDVFREVCKRTNIKGAILERDENFPDFTELLGELRTAREIVNAAKIKAARVEV